MDVKEALENYNNYNVRIAIIENDIFKLNEDLYSITINKNDIKDELSHKLPVAGSHLNDTI